MRRLSAVLGATLMIASVGCGAFRQGNEGTAQSDAVLRVTEDLVRDSHRFIYGRRDSIGPVANPDDPSFRLGSVSPRMQELADSMKERSEQIDQAKRQGCVGEDYRGYLAIREDSDESRALLADTERKNEMQQLVAGENDDRKDYYNELARVMNSEAVTLTVVERLFAQAWRDRAKSGQKFQLPPEGEDFDSVRASRFGKRLDDQCVPEAWVAVE